uniref:Uncharacterized protein n=1 Tax=Anopheles dirus TaxID=7168 RepID=A0A182MXW9_9DIPT
MINQSASGAFHTEYLYPMRFHPLGDQFNNQHSIFQTPGIQYHCLQVSVQCLQPYHNVTAPVTPVSTTRKPATRMLLLFFRCEHFVVKYLMYYKSSEFCYKLRIDQLAHRLIGTNPTCRTTLTRPYRIFGDGDRYLLIQYCLREFSDRKDRDQGYWLFVNKRNTPQQNQEILQRLALPEADFQSTNDLLCTTVSLVFDADSPGSCSKTIPNCKWFCDQGLPMANQSASGAFHTEYLFPLRYHPLAEQFNHLHSIFLTPGIHYHCLQLSVQCLRPYHNVSAATPVSVTQDITTRKLLLLFRCEHFVVKYLMSYQSPLLCYELGMDQFAHRLIRTSPTCRITLTRPYRLFGDGDRFLLIQYCLRGLPDKDQGYWLFVNKRNTPQQNQEILQQLALPEADFQSTIGTFSNLSVKASCRCDVFQRYIHTVRHCKKPFLTPYSAQHYQGEHRVSRMNDTNSSEDGIKRPEVQLEGIEMYWFVATLVVVGVGLGVTLYALYVQLDRQEEETIA